MESNIVPFGKYKGKPVEVLTADHQYRDWILQQAWFREKFSQIFEAIQGNGKQENTPAHNLMQAKFLDDRICLKIFETLPLIGIGLHDITHPARKIKLCDRHFEPINGFPSAISHSVTFAVGPE